MYRKSLGVLLKPTFSDYTLYDVGDGYGVTSGTGTVYPSGAPEFIPGFSGVRVTRSLVLYV